MQPTERHRAASRDRSQRRLTWLTAGTAAIAIVGTGGFAVAAAATYAGVPQSAAAEGSDEQTTDTGPELFEPQGADQVPTDPQATQATVGSTVPVPAPVTTTPSRKRHATSGGSH